MHNTRYDILFQPIKIGPVTAPNRFYQVPHCTGMGFRYPHSEAKLRGIKAQGGWGVVSTQETEIHPTSDITPANEARLWDDSDIPALRLVTDAVHEFGSLAAIQLAHSGLHVSNRYSRFTPLAPSCAVVSDDDPIQARGMDKTDIANFRRWHKTAALRGKQAGFDIIYVYAGHTMTLLHHFLLKRFNHRCDEYGGSLTNRLRLFREVIADTKDAVGDSCAIAVRLAVDELLGADGFRFNSEGMDVIAALAEEPDLWDVNLSDWSNDSQTARFSEEGYQEPYTKFVKTLTSKPVVGVGRYTSPDTMVRLIKNQHLDFIGGARPSIADPFLPNKIREGKIESIRECIGCNICVSGDNTCVPMRCTQNPTIGEEWRRNWHPEIIPPSPSLDSCLIIGGGAAGLEAAYTLAARKVNVTLADAADEWGGRITLECQLPGLATWARVRDWRMGKLQQVDNAHLYLQSPMTAQSILECGASHIALATGASWRTDGVGRAHRHPLDFLQQSTVLTPDDLMKKNSQPIPSDGPIVIFDDDRFYMASVLAEKLVQDNHKVIYVTPTAVAAAWTTHTLEQQRIQTRLLQLGVDILPLKTLADMSADTLSLQCIYSGKTTTIDCAHLIVVTSRLPNDSLWHELNASRDCWQDAGIQSITRIGDCLAPSHIASAIYEGHRYARQYGEKSPSSPPPLREDTTLPLPLPLTTPLNA